MDELRAITEQRGVFLRGEALDCGFDDATLIAARRSGELRRIRQGSYCFADEWKPLDERGRHLLLARAVLRTTTGPVALSHTTAMLLHGIDVWGADLTRVHLTRLDGASGRVRDDAVHHEGACTDSDVMIVEELPVLEPARAVVESATILGTESGLVSADSALHRKICTPDDLHRVFGQLNHWRGSMKVHVVLHHMDGRASNAGESRSMYMMWRHGVPTPIPQFQIRDSHGVLIAVLDFAWPEHHAFGEFDGREKYTEFLRPGETPGDAVFREKRREDLVREVTGWRGVRWVWVDLDFPRVTCARIQSVLDAAA